ncbi:MAG TPA: hypothetical protein VKG26_06630 [Bacteroidia bacterium]|nr:hypothetical protein [Bacteroidia bacterium]
MVEIFKTNVNNTFDALKIKEFLLKEFPQADISFNLQDSNKILRTEGNQIPASRVVQIIKHEGFYCEVIEQKI